MALTLNQDITTLSLALTGAMAFTSTVLVLASAWVRGRRVSSEGDEMYIGGESEEILRHKVPSVLALYWGIVRKAWKKAFETLKEAVHTGVLNDWYGYMSVWLGLAILIALLAIVIYIIG